MMLREGWDVQNVVTVVGLRPFKARSQILPEQALGRGIRPMFRGESVREKVSVVGTDPFIDFVEQIKSEGVELEYAPMGPRTGPKSPLTIEVDRDNVKKDLDELDIDIPVLTPRIYREYKNLEDLDVSSIPSPKLKIKTFSEHEKREIVFKDIDTDDVSHTTVLDARFPPTYQSVVGYFARTIMRDLRLVGGFDILFGKLKTFMEQMLFERPVSLDDLNIIRNLSEVEVTRAVLETFKAAVNSLTVQDRGTTEIRDRIKFGATRPHIVSNQPYLVPNRSVFSKVVGDSSFELQFAQFLDQCNDIVSFVKNSASTRFRIEYRTAEGSISNYYPDFVVKETDTHTWVIETKGREDREDPQKWERLQQWCRDATARDTAKTYQPLFVRQEKWDEYRPKTFRELKEGFQ